MGGRGDMNNLAGLLLLVLLSGCAPHGFHIGNGLFVEDIKITTSERCYLVKGTWLCPKADI